MDASVTPQALLKGLAAEIAAGTLIPYLGPEVLELGTDQPVVPTGARALSHQLCSKVAVPGRLRNNLWHTGQYIESHKHRVTLDRLMLEFFKPVPEPNALQRWLAGLDKLPLIIDTWYDGAMRAALAGRGDWGQIQGASKARRIECAEWVKYYDAAGAAAEPEAASSWKTVLYKPHGAAQPAGDVLASDADYVEVLTEIDIQTPIPDVVKDLRQGRGFLFLGCRFYDQILRTFAKQIIKRSGGPHYAVMPADLTPNELKFLSTEGIQVLTLPLAEAADILVGAQ